MMDFITIPAVLTVIGYFTYKLFALFVCKKERLYMLEHAKEIQIEGSVERLMLGRPVGDQSFSALKWGSFFLGIGLGIVVAYIINMCMMPYVQNVLRLDEWRVNELAGVVYGGCTLLFGGLSLILAFIAEIKLKNKAKAE